jgi:hypothetical protein
LAAFSPSSWPTMGIFLQASFMCTIFRVPYSSLFVCSHIFPLRLFIFNPGAKY